MHKRTWKKREGKAAAVFGTKRKPLSGSGGRDDQTRSDSMHPALFVEVKTRAKDAARTLYDGTKALAQKEGKTPVLMLATKGRPGFLVAFHTEDFAAVVAAYVAANQSDALEGRIRQAVEQLRGSLDFPQPPTEGET